jgi:hypothetical protein
MARLVPALLAASLLTLSGCVLVREHGHPGGRRAESHSGLSSRERDCHPSQYWDGEKCRHKGKGRGARKHDD